MSEKASPFRKAAGRSAIGALQPVAEHAAYGRRCPEADCKSATKWDPTRI